MLRNQSGHATHRLPGRWRHHCWGDYFLMRIGLSSEPVFTIAAADMVESSEIAPQSAEIQAYFDGHEIDLALTSKIMSSHFGHRMRMSGTRKMEGHDVVEMLVGCCGFPAKLVLAGLDTSAADLIRAGAARGEIQQTSLIGDYLAVVVSHHQTPKLSELIRAVPDAVV